MNFIFISHNFTARGKIWTQQIDVAPNVWLHSSVGRASDRCRGGHGVESRWSPDIFQASSFQLLKLENLLRWSLFTFIYNRSTIWISYIFHSKVQLAFHVSQQVSEGSLQTWRTDLRKVWMEKRTDRGIRRTKKHAQQWHSSSLLGPWGQARRPATLMTTILFFPGPACEPCRPVDLPSFWLPGILLCRS